MSRTLSWNSQKNLWPNFVHRLQVVIFVPYFRIQSLICPLKMVKGEKKNVMTCNFYKFLINLRIRQNFKLNILSYSTF